MSVSIFTIERVIKIRLADVFDLDVIPNNRCGSCDFGHRQAEGRLRNLCPSFLKLHNIDRFFILQEKKKYIPAVTHIDGTGRVQIVNKNLNNRFYNLIFEFYKKTNVPILLNTSFNENEPIIRTPQEAIDCFIRTKMDLLIIENFVIERENN